MAPGPAPASPAPARVCSPAAPRRRHAWPGKRAARRSPSAAGTGASPPGPSGGRRRVSAPGSHLGAPALSRRLSCSSLYKTIFSKRGKMQTCEAIPGVTADPSVTDCRCRYEPAQGEAENKRRQQRSPSGVALESTGALPAGCEDGPSSRLWGTLSLVWVSREYPCLLPSLFPLIFLIFPFKICCSSHFVGRGSQSRQSCRLAGGGRNTCPQDGRAAGLRAKTCPRPSRRALPSSVRFRESRETEPSGAARHVHGAQEGEDGATWPPASPCLPPPPPCSLGTPRLP